MRIRRFFSMFEKFLLKNQPKKNKNKIYIERPNRRKRTFAIYSYSLRLKKNNGKKFLTLFAEAVP